MHMEGHELAQRKCVCRGVARAASDGYCCGVSGMVWKEEVSNARRSVAAKKGAGIPVVFDLFSAWPVTVDGGRWPRNMYRCVVHPLLFYRLRFGEGLAGRMMDWLNKNAGLATWLGLVVAVVTVAIQNRNKKFHDVDWSRLLIYFAFLASLAVMFTPQIDNSARDVARGLVFAILGFLIVDRRQRTK